MAAVGPARIRAAVLAAVVPSLAVGIGAGIPLGFAGFAFIHSALFTVVPAAPPLLAQAALIVALGVAAAALPLAWSAAKASPSTYLRE